MLNTIYNACDVGVNTCKGEGWGLVNFEHAACNVPQVVPDHTSCKEIFEGYGELIRCDHIDVDTNYAREMPCPSSDHLAEILEYLYQDKGIREWVGTRCRERVMDPQFSWDTVASQFGGIFEDVMNQVDHSVPVEISEKPRKRKKSRTLRKEMAAAVS
jgi:glycosyltransferase involved in cell wall biosynthesis